MMLLVVFVATCMNPEKTKAEEPSKCSCSYLINYSFNTMKRIIMPRIESSGIATWSERIQIWRKIRLDSFQKMNRKIL